MSDYKVPERICGERKYGEKVEFVCVKEPHSPFTEHRFIKEPAEQTLEAMHREELAAMLMIAKGVDKPTAIKMLDEAHSGIQA